MARGYPKCDHFLKYNSWGTRPHSSACRSRIVTELAKTEEGRSRLGMAAERLDKTVKHPGMQFREDLPQGEIDEHQVVVQNPHKQLPLD